MRQHLFSIGIVVAAALAAPACTSLETGKSISSPAAPSPVTGGSSSGTLVGYWGSQANLPVPSAASCTNFQWQIASQSESAVAGSFSATCDGGLTITADAPQAC